MSDRQHTPGPFLSAKDAATYAFAERDRLRESNAELVKVLKQIAYDTKDTEPPFRSLDASGPIRAIARAALAKAEPSK